MSTRKLKDDNGNKERVKALLDETNGLLQDHESDDVLRYASWVKDKVDLKYYKEDPTFMIINNGLYWAFLGENVGSEQGLHRPVLVVNTVYSSPVCTIIPLTLERLSDGYWYHIDLENTNSTALVEHIRVISKKRIDKPMRLGGLIKTITDEDWKKINGQLESLYRLKPLTKPKKR